MGPFPQPNLTLPVPLRRVRGRACDYGSSPDSKCPRSTAFALAYCRWTKVEVSANRWLSRTIFTRSDSLARAGGPRARAGANFQGPQGTTCYKIVPS